MDRSDADPDALWKPGYDGPWHLPARDADPVSSRPGRDGPSGRQLAISALLGLVLVAALTVVLVTGDDTTDPDDAGDQVQVDPWSITFPTIRIGALTSTPETLVVLVDRPGSVVAIDRRDGRVDWTGSAPGTSATGLDVVDGVVLARHVEADGVGSVVAHELVDGLPVWRDVLAVGERIDVIDGVAWRTGGAGRRPAPLDPRTGEPVEVTDPAPDGAATDHVLRGMGPGQEVELAIDGAIVRVVVDGSTSSVTLVHRRTDGPDAVDPSPGSPTSVP